MNNGSTFSFIIENKESLVEFVGEKEIPYFTPGIYHHQIHKRKKE